MSANYDDGYIMPSESHTAADGTHNQGSIQMSPDFLPAWGLGHGIRLHDPKS